jgi:hypothetical protein
MDIEKFSDLLLIRDYSEVEAVLKNGFNPNTPLEQNKTAIEWCSYSNDYKMIEILWRFGGVPTTDWTKEIVDEFEKGKTVEEFLNPNTSKEKVSNDLTKNFDVNRFEFLDGNIEFDNNEYSIIIPIVKFILDEQVTETSIRLENIALTGDIKNLINKSINFPLNPKEGYIDGSIYLRNCHNPVDVSQIEFLKISDDYIATKITADFIFDYENIGFPNQKRTIETKLKIGNKA